VCSENVLGVETQEFDFDGLPGATHEFKVYIPGQSEDCFFQPVAEGAQLWVSFEVLRGNDPIVDFYVRDMQWQNLKAQRLVKEGHFKIDQAQAAATYAVCVDNPRYGTKLLYFYIATFVMQEWKDFEKEISEMHFLARNFSNSIDTVTEQVAEMKKSQVTSRFHVVKDWYLLTSNERYVYNWSLAQCCLIVVSALVQVYTLRRLFRSVNVTPTLKPRA